MKNCKCCGDSKLVKNGLSKEKNQRYKCKACGSTFCEGDKRLKHGLEKKLKAIKMYLEGVGIRSIERLESVSSPLLIYWIRHYAELIRKEIRLAPIPDKLEDIEILEMDELFTYYKKKGGLHMSGLLLSESGIKLLTLR